MFDNVGIKYELKNCFKAFRKAHPDEEKRNDISALITNIEEQMKLCKSSVGKFLEEENSILESIQKFNETE